MGHTKLKKKKKKVKYLIVRKLNILHGQERELVSSMRVSAMLHVPRDREQLRRRHGLRRRVDHDLVGSLEGDRLVLAQSQGTQSAV
jgi:hypothetical protein